MSRDKLIQFLRDSAGEADNPVFRLLMKITLDFRDKRKWEYGKTLTVAEVKLCMASLTKVFDGNQPDDNLTDVQRQLLKLWIDAIRDFNEE